MERNYMKADTIAELDFITEPETKIHTHENFELLYLIEGKLKLKVEREAFWMKPGDMVLVNVNRKHYYVSEGEILIGRFVLSDLTLREILGKDQIIFYCNSTEDRNSAYEDLRSTILQIFNYALGDRNRNRLYLTSMYFQMLHILAESFLLNKSDIRYIQETEQEDGRMDSIFAYIRANYRQTISLEQLSKHLYLSQSYVSRYIKSKCGMNFVELVNQVRLGHAMEELMYSDDSITKIALDTGFASLSAYNKVFREVYGMTPSEFRQERKNSSSRKNRERKALNEETRQKIESYLEQNPLNSEQGSVKRNLEIKADLNCVQDMPWDPFCCKMINIGCAEDLLNAEIQSQILERRQNMGFQYVRFWDIYSPSLYLDPHAETNQQNYSRLNIILDFLVKNHLKPYIELGVKPVRILQTMQNSIREINRVVDFSDDQERYRFYYELIRHFTKRYGSEEVRTWYFEYWKNNNIVYQNKLYHRELILDHERYLREFDIIASAFRTRLPGVRIGGGGFSIRMEGEKNFRQFLELWAKETQIPDFVTLNCFPYVQEMEKGVMYEHRSTDVDFMEHCIRSTREIMHEIGWDNKELHISEYSFSLSNRNNLNDSCLKGAFLVYNALKCFGKLNLAGHWLFTDAYSDDKDTDRPLFGGCGLLTKNGIPKPSFYAMDYLNRLYPSVLEKQANYIVTRSERGSVRIVCHNMKKLNYNYFLTPEDQIKVQDISGLQENREYLSIHITLDNMKPGTYVMRKNNLNRKHGSVQDIWMELNMEQDLTMHELNYLRTSSISHNCVTQMEVKGTTMEFDTILEPNEIQYLYILQK